MNPDRSVSPDDVRRSLRELLNEIEHQDVHLTVERYGKPAAVIVPVGWYEAARRQLGAMSSDITGHDCPMASTYATVDMTNYCGHPSHGRQS